MQSVTLAYADDASQTGYRYLERGLGVTVGERVREWQAKLQRKREQER